MPLKEFKCDKCGKTFDKIVSISVTTCNCPDCGRECQINYNGKCYCIKGGSGGCDGNCGGCKGCKA
jgi:putative FmdB family regulatory protein